MEPYDDLDPQPPRDLSRAAFGLGVLLAGLAVGVGSAVLLARLASPEALPPQVGISEAPADAEPAGDDLLAAHDRVLNLEALLAAREAELAEVSHAANAEPDADLVAHVSSVRENLQAARGVRDRLRRELEAALAQVDEQTREATIARGDASDWKRASVQSRWTAFVATAEAEVCDRGSRASLARCRASVQAAFTDADAERFVACAESGGAAPVLRQQERGEELPATAEPLEGVGRRWYVVWCDPSLPERVSMLE